MDEAEYLSLSYKDAPTLKRFKESDAFIRGVMGPVGSGKSSACCWEVLWRAMGQRPGNDGVRRTRFAVVRNTDKELLDTTLKTWMEWFPDGRAGSWHKAERVFVLRGSDPKTGDSFESEVLFRAMDIPKQVRDLLSLELTGAWLNEAREIEESIFRGLLNMGRIGRYPPMKEGGATWSGIWMDTNPPDDLSWWYQLFEEDAQEDPDIRLFRQPGARTKKAENLPNLPADYYAKVMTGAREEYIRVYVDAEYGTVEEGKAIYANEWSDAMHVAKTDLEAMPGRELIIGLDFGLTPAAALCQLSPRGALRVVEELVADGMGVQRFAEEMLIPALSARYGDLDKVFIGDPAGRTRAETDERSAFDVLRECGIRVDPAPTNQPTARWEAVRWFLTRIVDGAPAFSISPRCRYLRRGFNGRYKLRRLQTREERYAEKADKNETSHPHDALQYACLHFRKEMKRPKKEPKTAAGVHRGSHGWLGA